MEIDKKLTDCLALLLHHGLEEEHNFAVGMLGYIFNYLESKLVLFPIQIHTLLEDKHKSDVLHLIAVAEDGEIVSSKDDKPTVKEETIDEDDNKETSHEATGDLAGIHKEKEVPLQKVKHRIRKSKVKELKPKHEDKEKTNILGIAANEDSKIGLDYKEPEKKDTCASYKSRNVASFTKDGPISYKCDCCPFSLDNPIPEMIKHSSAKLRKHKKKEHNVCEVCKEKQESTDELENHMILVHTSSSGEPMCGIDDCKVVPKIQGGKIIGLLLHVRVVHDKVSFICGECGRSYRSWDKHVKYHTAQPEDFLFCKQCDFSTLSTRLLNSHQKQEHPKPGKKKQVLKKLTCDSCPYTTYGISGELEGMHLILHKKIHRDGNIVCDMCDFVSKKKYSFQSHLAINHNIGQFFSCTFCDYTTSGHSAKGHLKAHMETHNKEKAYMCDKCDFKSGVGTLFKRHMQRHHESYRYMCDECEYKSNDSSNFIGHKKVKHGNVILSCAKCEFTSKSARTLRNHKTKKHG